MSEFAGMKLIARSAKAVIVRLGFTPRLAAITEPSQMYMFLYPKTRCCESTTPCVAESAMTQPPIQWAVPGTLKRIYGRVLIPVPPATSANFLAN